MDDSGLANCVVFSCDNPPVNGGVYCAKHVSLVPPPSPPIVGTDEPADPGPPVPDMMAMEPQWDGTQWVLRPKQSNDAFDRLRRIQTLVRGLMAECGIEETGGNER